MDSCLLVLRSHQKLFTLDSYKKHSNRISYYSLSFSRVILQPNPGNCCSKSKCSHLYAQFDGSLWFKLQDCPNYVSKKCVSVPFRSAVLAIQSTPERMWEAPLQMSPVKGFPFLFDLRH